MRYAFSNVARVSAPPSSDLDWIARSTASGVEVANRLEDLTTLTDWIVSDSTSDHVSIDTSVKASSYAAGSFKFSILNADTTASGSVCVPFSAKGEGDVIWFSYRVRADDAAAYQQYVNNAESGTKVSILSRDANGSAPTLSNQVNEIVVAINYSGNHWSMYHRTNSSSGDAPDVGAVTACSGSDFRWQPEIDNGSSPLSGSSPDGDAWSNCEKDRARYGGLYSAKTNAEYEPGLGDPLSGGVKQEGGVWFTVTMRCEINDLDDTLLTNRLTQWVAKDGEAYIMLSDQYVKLGTGPDYNGLTLLPYVTSRSDGGRKSTLSGISGVSILGTGGGTHTGSGSLEYVASTGAFRFAASNDSYGTARYIDAINGIYTMNLKSSLHGTATTTNGTVTLPQSSIVLTDASAFPAGGGSFTLGEPDTSNAGASGGDGEQYLTYTGKSGNTLTGCSGGDGTHLSGVVVKIRSYIAVRVDNVASLPSSGTTTATVTVSDGRNDGQVNYQDVIISSGPINAPGGYPPLGIGVIADAAAGMSSGDWLQLTGADLPTGLGNFVGGSASGIATHYASNIEYDRVGGKMYWIGCDHGQDQKFLEYDEATNAWSLLTATPFAAATKHAYNHSVWDSTNRKLWHRPFNELAIRRWDGGGTWTTVSYSSVVANASAANGCVFFPEYDGGKIIVFQDENGTKGELFKIDPVTNTVTTIIDESTGTLDPTGSIHNFALYNPISQVIIFGGGNSNSKIWKMDSSGTVTALTDIPGALGDLGPATGMGRIFPNPVNGGFIAMKGTTNWYDLDVSGSGTWTARGGTISMLTSNVYNSGDPTNGTIGVALYNYGVLAFVKAWSSASDAQMWLFKP